MRKSKENSEKWLIVRFLEKPYYQLGIIRSLLYSPWGSMISFT